MQIKLLASVSHPYQYHPHLLVALMLFLSQLRAKILWFYDPLSLGQAATREEVLPKKLQTKGKTRDNKKIWTTLKKKWDNIDQRDSQHIQDLSSLAAQMVWKRLMILICRRLQELFQRLMAAWGKSTEGSLWTSWSSTRPTARFCTWLGTIPSTNTWADNALRAEGRTWGCWLTRSSAWAISVCSQPRKPAVCLAASKGTCPGGRGRWFFHSALLWWDHTLSTTSSLVVLKIRRAWTCWSESRVGPWRWLEGQSKLPRKQPQAARFFHFSSWGTHILMAEARCWDDCFEDHRIIE